MAAKEMWEQIGEGFVGEYYRRFDKNELRPSLGELYGNESCLTWEGERFPGRTGIVGKLTSLPFGAIQHVITSQDHQPTPDNCIVSMVTGQLKADNDPVMGFQQIFMLRLQDGAWVCTNDIFRLALHNFA